MNKVFKMNLQLFAEKTSSIFELITASEIVAYWEEMTKDIEMLLGDELFPEEQKLGLDLKWIKGAMGMPVVLKPSAYDVASMKRDRIGFDKVSAEMPFFKESIYIDEELRQQLNMVIETGNQAYIDAVITRVFGDEVSLLRGAKAQRERMKMMLLTTGAISIQANGQSYDYNYGVSADQKVTVKKSWSDPTASIIDDIDEWMESRETATGIRPTRGVISRKTWSYFKKNNDIRNAIWGSNSAAPVSDSKIKEYIMSELGLSLVVYSKKFIDENGAKSSYVPDDMIVLFPSGKLGTGWFGTTPEQSDLLSGSAANVAITDVGVAVTTVKMTDPVNVDTKVSMIFLPSFETVDQIVIADVVI